MDCKRKTQIKWLGRITEIEGKFYALVKKKGNKNYKEIGKYNTRSEAKEAIRKFARRNM